MSTTPVPTTAAAHLAIVEALRKVGEREMTDISFEGHAEHLVCSDCACDPCDEDCRTGIARAAREGWEKRPRLSQDEDAIELVRREAALSRQGARHLLDALEPLLFGAGSRTGGEGG